MGIYITDSSNRYPAAVICDLYITGLSMIRDFAIHEIPVIGIDPDPTRIGFSTKYGKKLVCPDPLTKEYELLEFLNRLGGSLPFGGILFPTSDNFVLFISKHRDDLGQYFKFAMPDHTTVEKLVSKRGLIEIAKEARFPVPQTFFPHNKKEAVLFSKQIEYPSVIKPEFSQSWHKEKVLPYTMGNKVIKVFSPNELLEVYENLSKIDSKLVFQEIVPGGDDQLFYFVSYMNKNTEPLGIFAGRKLRLMPIHFGSASYVESFRDLELEEKCLHLLKSCGYYGLSGIEVKKDYRDGQYKLIEINARFGLWDILATRCGVDFPFIAYQDILGNSVKPRVNYRTGVKWISFENDIRAFIHYKKEGSLSFSKWIYSWKGEKEWAVLSWKDPLPAIRMLSHMVAVGMSHILKALHHRLR